MIEHRSRTLEQLSSLLGLRNSIDERIARIIGRPATTGHIGEFVASAVFDIELEASATNSAFDGFFRSGPVAGRTVNIKTYGKRQGMIDIHIARVPDAYRVLAGPRAVAASSRRTNRPWAIEEVFLFDAPALIARLGTRGVQLGIAISVTLGEWKSARVYPPSKGGPLNLGPEALRLLTLFHGTPGART